MNHNDWLPGAGITTLARRAAYVAYIRNFFARRGIMEVETPLLCSHAVTDPYVDALAVQTSNGTRYLQTSPEYMMKRLLAAGSGSIYQLCKAFRDDPSGRWHHPEFTMLEWYHVGIDHLGLIAEITELLQGLQPHWHIVTLSYGELFASHTGLNPHTADLASLQQYIHTTLGNIEGLSQPDSCQCLDVIFSMVIEPALADQADVVFVYDYPAIQAALARVVHKEGIDVAERFEVFIQGVEIANGYHEVLDAEVLARRFEHDNQSRRVLGKPQMPVDQAFLQAHRYGLPACAGVALGFDRLFMLCEELTDLSEAISFRG